MNNKLLAVLAVVAVAFAAVAVVTEINENDAAGTLDITISSLTGGTITTDPGAGTGVANEGDKIVITVAPNSGYKLKDGTLSVLYGSSVAVPIVKEVTKYTFTMPSSSVTISAEFEQAYNITIDDELSGGAISTYPAGTAYVGETVNVFVTPGAGKMLEYGSLKYNSSEVIYGYSFTMPAANVEITANFVDATYIPTSFAYGYDTDTTPAPADYNGMKVIAYDDKALLIDTNAMELSASQNTFYVGINPVIGTADAELKIGPVVAQNGRIWIDASGQNIAATPADLLHDGASLITLYAYDTGAAISYATLTWTDEPAVLSLKTNHNAAWTKVNYDSAAESYVAYDDKEYPRTTDTIVLDETITVNDGVNPVTYPFNAFAYGFQLKGWSLTYVGDSKIVMVPTTNLYDDTHTTPVDQTDFVTIEEVIFAMADHITKNNVLDPDADPDAFVEPIVSNKITLFAIWEEILYTIEVGDETAVGDLDDGEFEHPFEFGINNVRLNPAGTTPNLTQDGFASVTSKVSKNSFALLRMQQDKDAQFTTAPQYTYTLKVYYATVDPATGVKTWALAGEYQKAADAENLAKYAKIDMINNGIYKISNVKADLRITVLMAENTGVPATNAYAFQIDQINNDSNGFVNLSLDLFDYTARYQDNGLPKEAAGFELIQAQQIAIEGTYFKTLGDGATAQRVYGDLKNAAVTAKAYVDLKEDSEQLTNYQVDDDRVVNGRAMQLTKENSVFDLSYQLGTGVSIYAAQGVWNTLDYDSGDFDHFDATIEEVKTPWALYKA